ncbi:PiggyBac-like protein Tpb2p (macronuclear) [Tetrahymena thermophila SB210]|uniref:PiggyBac-like protein Tpb2p n=2 Tax=Tetrahymena thermophila TaxID=5911 RepID=Q22BD4_TETTS|nr:PiggyBac-like protein Tpb2p [Tetrahymena thermophila SB210]EAR82574.2 PiggyBac-like protein Tpb2p [Tetrahymena thermophila SB210]BAI68044.1 piggyBac-like protein Tpb2p [Tetrahymena thermophila]|eukprot:XP_001030237.2 PiggyBac-like protein Tpb2p [Tetrahymena thermophila SB210]
MKRDINTPIDKMKFYQPLDKEGQPVVMYDDGTIKKLGQKRTYEGQPEQYIVKTKKNDVYLVEKSKKVRKARKRKQFQEGEDAKKPLTEKEVEKRWTEFSKENKMRQQHKEDDLIDDQWRRIYSVDQVPKSFYMKTKFDKDLNRDFIPYNVPHSPYHLFRMFFDDRIYKLIIEETNRYKHQKYQEALLNLPPDKTLPKEAMDIDSIDLDAYLSILIFMGVQRMKSVKDYWKRKNYINSEIACIMKYSRFEQIDKHLHLADNEDPKIRSDPIGKVRQYMDYLNENFKKYYYPGEFLAIDEGMIPFNGKVAFKVYNPDKPDKFGIKEYVCCDSQNAYTLESQLYYGNHENEEFPEITLSKTNEVVMNLLKDYEGRFHKVVMDNYYNSPTLFYLMKQKSFGALGTMRIGRLKLPPYLLSQIMEVHQNKVLSYIQGDINLAIFFRGTNDKEICLMSNFIDQKKVKDDFWRVLAYVKEDRDIFKEQNLQSAYYNKYKGGVDRRNSYLAAYRNCRKNIKWYRPVFYRMLDNAIVNAFILYNFNLSPKYKISQKEFRIQLFKELACRYSPSKSQHAIKVQQFMKDKSAEVDKIPQYFEKAMKLHIMKNCDYSAHILVRSRTKKKSCIECKQLTLFSCSTCSNMFKMRIPLCQSGFNQCYDFHASKTYEEVVEDMFTKRRKDGRKLDIEIKKKKKKLVKLSDVYDSILKPKQSNQNPIQVKTKQILQKSVTIDHYTSNKAFLEDDMYSENQPNSTELNDQSTRMKTNQIMSSSNSNSIQGSKKKKFKVIKKEKNLKTQKTKSCDAIFSSEKIKKKYTDEINEFFDSKASIRLTNFFQESQRLQNLLKESQENLSKKFVVLDQTSDEDFKNNNTDEDLQWINTTLEKINQKKIEPNEKLSPGLGIINKKQEAEEVIEVLSSSSTLNEEKVRTKYQEIPFTFGSILEVEQEKEESDDEVAKEYKKVSKRIEEFNEDSIHSKQQLEDSNFFPQKAGVIFYSMSELDKKKEQVISDQNKEQNQIIVKQEHRSDQKKKNSYPLQLYDCENVLNNAIDFSDYSFSSSDEEQFVYNKNKNKQQELNHESDTNNPQLQYKGKIKNNKFKIDESFDESNLKIERPFDLIPFTFQNDAMQTSQNFVVIDDDSDVEFQNINSQIINQSSIISESQKLEFEGFIDNPQPTKKRIISCQDMKRKIIIKKNKEPKNDNQNIIYINHQRFKIVKLKTTIQIDSD